MKATWLRTNLAEQARYVRESGRVDDILAAKIWRRKQAVYFPSFCLELAVIEALGTGGGGLGVSLRFERVLEWLAEEVPRTELRDPANRNNLVSEVMTESEKWRVANGGGGSLCAGRRVAAVGGGSGGGADAQASHETVAGCIRTRGASGNIGY
jgi:hypothetical protein